MKCFEAYKACNMLCEDRECRQWIDYEKDLNCTIIAIANNNEEPMTLREVAARLSGAAAAAAAAARPGGCSRTRRMSPAGQRALMARLARQRRRGGTGYAEARKCAC